MAYVPIAPWQKAWKRYRGGQTTPIWIVRLSDLNIQKIPRNNTNDTTRCGWAVRIYFLSDRNGPQSLFAYDPGTKRVSQVVKNEGMDIKSASAGPGAIVYEQFGSLHLFDTATGKEHPLDIRIAGDLLEVRPHY